MTISPFKIIVLYVGIVSHLLYSFYFYEVGIAPFALISAIILNIFCFLNFNKAKRLYSVGNKTLVALIMFIILSFFWSILTCYVKGYKFYPQSFVAILLNLGIFFGFIGLSANDKIKKHVFKSIVIFFVISLCVFYIQAVAWYAFGIEIDFLLKITGEEQRLIGHGMLVNGVVTRRASGIFAEPAVYSWVMVGIGYFLIDSLRGSKLKLPIYLMYILSILASYSLSGWIQAVFAEFLRVARSRKIKTGLYLIITLGVIYFLLQPFIDAYWQGRVSILADDGSYNDKISAFKVVEKYFSEIYYLILGVGISTKFDTPALSFFTSSLLLLGVLGTFIVYVLVSSTLLKLPGNFIDKLFIAIYILFFGNHITSTINWFVLGCMTFLMIRNKSIRK
jgi:hypothetical protein